MLLMSALLAMDTLQAVSRLVRSKQSAAVILAFDGTLLQGEELEVRKAFLEERLENMALDIYIFIL